MSNADPTTREHVEQCVEAWRTRLIDLTGRNRLIRLREAGAEPVLRLDRPAAGAVWRRLLSGRPVDFFRKNSLLRAHPLEPDADRPADADLSGWARLNVRPHQALTELSDEALDRRLSRLRDRDRETEKERGVPSLYLALGALLWRETDDGEPVKSPLLLVQVRLVPPAGNAPWRVAADEPELLRNDALAARMKRDCRYEWPALAQPVGEDAVSRYAQAAHQLVHRRKGWEVLPDYAAVGNFAFAKLAMWRDLGDNVELVAKHWFVRALAGDPSGVPLPPAALPDAERATGAAMDDAIRPEEAACVLDADGSQLAAVEAIRRGADLVLEGPPGTGKSQTITNVIAECLRLDKSVLFVSEKAVALEVVLRQLRAQGLGDFCLDIHAASGGNVRKQVADDLNAALGATSGDDGAPALRPGRYSALRDELNGYARALHRRREPLGWSAFQVHGLLSRPSPRTRLDLPQDRLLDGDYYERAGEILEDVAPCEAAVRGRESHPWRGTRVGTFALKTQDEAQHHLGRLATLTHKLAEAAGFLASAGLTGPAPGVEEWERADAGARALLAVPEIPPGWLTADARSAAEAVRAVDRVSRQVRGAAERLSDLGATAVADPATTADRLGASPSLREAGVGRLESGTVRAVGAELDAVSAAFDRLLGLIQGTASATEALLRSMGVAQITVPLDRSLTLLQCGKHAEQAGEVPAEWWDGRRRTELLAAARTALAAAIDCDTLHGELSPHLTPGTLSDPSPDPWDRLAGELSAAEAVELPKPSELEGRRRAAEAVASAAETLAEAGRAVVGAADDTGASVAALGALAAAAAGGEAADADGLWGESERCRGRARAIQMELAPRLTPEALGGNYDAEADAAEWYRPWYRRWGAGWTTFRKSTRRLYPGSAPAPAQLLADCERLSDRRRMLRRAERLAAAANVLEAAGRLTASLQAMPAAPAALAGHTAPPAAARTTPEQVRSWAVVQAGVARRQADALAQIHGALTPAAGRKLTARSVRSLAGRLRRLAERGETVRAFAASHADTMPSTSTSSRTAQLRDFVGKLEAVEALATGHPRLAPALARTLAPGAGFDPAALAERRRHLVERARAFREAWAALASKCELGYTVDASGFPPLAPASIADALLPRKDAVAAARRFADGFAAGLATGRDVGWSEVPKLLDGLRDLAALRLELAGATLTSPLGVGAAEAEARDWGEEASCATELLRYLNTHGPLDAADAAALCDPDRRADLRNAVERSDGLRREGFSESWRYLTATLFPPDVPVSTGVVLNRTPVEELAPWLAERSRDVAGLSGWLHYTALERKCRDNGLSTLLDEVATGVLPAADAKAAFQGAFQRAWYDNVRYEEPVLADFDPAAHDATARRFREADNALREGAADRIRAAALGRLSVPDETRKKVKQESAKSRSRTTAREMVALPAIIGGLKPCLMMSPLSVSTYLPPEPLFDVVIFDEASQVRPHEAIPAIYRGRQLVVAGDPKQLPPSNFFAADAGVNEEQDGQPGSELDDLASLLDACLDPKVGMTTRSLLWHYRSRREGLIAFSNRHFYDGRLATFPSAHDVQGGGRAVTLRYVEGGFFAGRRNAVEARAVAEAVVRHARETPDASLGVVAFSAEQMEAIGEELRSLRQGQPGLDGFFDPDGPDPFFVKNLENVQGDERHTILLSVGYGPRAAGGKPVLQIGPISMPGGERRLNVAVTRATDRVVVFSSMRAEQMPVTGQHSAGVRLLRDYLDYAERGPAALAAAVTEANDRPPGSPFEEAVATALRARGLTLHTQVGCGGYFIDMAVVDPGRPGRYVLGVECDGATYHSSATARDRDRLRQQVLERLGWKLVRVWSTDWFRDPDAQVLKVLRAVPALTPKP